MDAAGGSIPYLEIVIHGLISILPRAIEFVRGALAFARLPFCNILIDAVFDAFQVSRNGIEAALESAFRLLHRGAIDLKAEFEFRALGVIFSCGANLLPIIFTVA